MVGAPPPPLTCSNEQYVLVSSTDTTATYEVAGAPVLCHDFGVLIVGTLLVAGPVLVQVTAVDADEPLAMPTATVSLSGPGYDEAPGYLFITHLTTTGDVRGWTLSWDTPGAFSTLCCLAIYAE